MVEVVVVVIGDVVVVVAGSAVVEEAGTVVTGGSAVTLSGGSAISVASTDPHAETANTDAPRMIPSRVFLMPST